MVNALTAVASPRKAAPQAQARSTDATSAAQSVTPSTSTKVSLSAAAQAAAANMEEARETPAQTEQEATRGDIQAKHLVARETAAKAYAA